MRKSDMCEVRLTIINRVPISMEAVYERPMHDDKGKLLVKTEQYVGETYFFKEVSEKELMELRLEGNPGVVYKIDGKFFYTPVSEDLKLTRANSGHLCGKNCTNVCKDCTRTKDLTVSFQERFGKEYPYSILASWRIEKYDYITEGMEAFNMKRDSDALMVYECSNFAVSSRSEGMAKVINADMKTSLATFYWPDFDGDLRAMRNRIKANLGSEAMKVG